MGLRGILITLAVFGACCRGVAQTIPSSQPSETAATTTTTPAAAPYSGDILTRSTMTGDWGGFRNTLANKGVTIDFSVTQTYQGLTGGGQKPGLLLPRSGSGVRDWQYSGVGDLLLNVDTGAAGLWAGGYFTVETEGNWGNNFSTSQQSGAISPVNMNAIYLTPVQNGIAVTDVSFAQFLSDNLGIFLGKVATITQTSGDMNDFAHGKGDSQFMNVAFNFNPVALLSPYSSLGAGVILLPGKNPDDADITFAAVDPNGQPGTAGFNTLGSDGTLFSLEGRVKTGFFDLTGHQLVGGMYSDKAYTSLNQNLRLIIDNRQIQTAIGWSVYYNFDQYLFEHKDEAGQTHGWGVFGRFGASDGNTIPIKYFYSIGLGGDGLLPFRPDDGFGFGYYFANITSSNVPAFLGLSNEWGMEAFYNIHFTPWCQLTPDLQYVEGGRNFAQPVWVAGARLKLIF